MHRLIIYLILLGYSGEVFGSCIKILPESWNFNEINEDEEKKIKHIILTNTSSSTLTIFRIKSNCRCIKVYPDESINLAPFGTMSLKIVFYPKGRIGKIRKFVYFYSSCKDSPILRFAIYGEVRKRTNKTY